MVKNFGGKKTKGMARKNLTARPSNILRLSHCELEKYSQVVKTLGNGMCHVLCDDNVTRLCHIRGKFRGRGKRDNFITNGSWTLVGIREYECGGDGKKMQNCDLLEVYNDQDRERLKSSVTGVNWRLFATNRVTNETHNEADDIQFMDEKEEEYYDLMNKELENNKKTKTKENENEMKTIAFGEEEEINIDDI